MLPVGWAVQDCCFEVDADLVGGLGHAAVVGMVVGVEAGEQLLDFDYSVCWELLEAVIDCGDPLLRYIMSDILDELSIVDPSIFPEAFLDSPDFLRGQENTKRVQKQIECMLVHQACAFGIELAYFAIAFLEVFHCFPE